MFARFGHTYVGGASVPWFVTDDMLKSGAQRYGFEQVEVHSRKSYPIHKLPTLPPGTSNDWDTLLIGRRFLPDGEVHPPSGFRWAVDVSPVAPQPVPVPEPQPAPAPVVQAGPGWDWPVPTPPPAATGDTSLQMPLLIGMGVLGGAFFGYQAYSHMFKEGLAEKERSNILKAAGAMLALFGVSLLIDVDKAWWLTPQGLAAKAEEEAVKAGARIP